MKANPISIRLPADLKEWLAERAEFHHRSRSMELVAILAHLRKCENEDAAWDKFAHPDDGIPVASKKGEVA